MPQENSAFQSKLSILFIALLFMSALPSQAEAQIFDCATKTETTGAAFMLINDGDESWDVGTTDGPTMTDAVTVDVKQGFAAKSFGLVGEFIGDCEEKGSTIYCHSSIGESQPSSTVANIMISPLRQGLRTFVYSTIEDSVMFVVAAGTCIKR